VTGDYVHFAVVATEFVRQRSRARWARSRSCPPFDMHIYLPLIVRRKGVWSCDVGSAFVKILSRMDVKLRPWSLGLNKLGPAVACTPIRRASSTACLIVLGR
jgi:hypothetical protein